MSRCGEDDFYDMSIGGCVQCDMICHTRQGNTDLDKCELYCKGFLSKHPEIMDHINRNHPIRTTLHQQYPISPHNPLFSTTTTPNRSGHPPELTLVAVISVILVLLSLGVLVVAVVMIRRKKSKNQNVEESNLNMVTALSGSIHVHDFSDKSEDGMKKHHLSGNSECSASSRTALLQNLVDKQPTEHQKKILERNLSTTSSRGEPAELMILGVEGSGGPSRDRSSLTLQEQLRLNGIEWEPHEKGVHRANNDTSTRMAVSQERLINLLPTDSKCVYGCVGMCQRVRDCELELTNRKLLSNLNPASQHNEQHELSAVDDQREPQTSSFFIWMQDTDWIEEYIPTADQLRVGINSSAITRDRAKLEIERKMKYFAIKWNLSVFPASEGRYIQTMFPSPSHQPSRPITSPSHQPSRPTTSPVHQVNRPITSLISPAYQQSGPIVVDSSDDEVYTFDDGIPAENSHQQYFHHSSYTENPDLAKNFSPGNFPAWRRNQSGFYDGSTARMEESLAYSSGYSSMASNLASSSWVDPAPDPSVMSQSLNLSPNMEDFPIRRRSSSYSEGIDDSENTPLDLSQRSGRDFPSMLGSEVVQISPGTQLFCHCMEDGENLPGYAEYGCCIEVNGMIYGLTVGHLFRDVRLECKLKDRNGVVVGTCVEKIQSVPTNRGTIFADLSLIRFEPNIQPVNKVRIKKRRYGLKFYKGDINDLQNADVIRVSPVDGSCVSGIITAPQYTNKHNHIFNAIAVNDKTEWQCANVRKRINEVGNSGSLILSCPNQEDYLRDQDLYVYGLVTGYHENDQKTESTTIVCPLYDTLRAYFKHDNIKLLETA